MFHVKHFIIIILSNPTHFQVILYSIYQNSKLILLYKHSFFKRPPMKYICLFFFIFLPFFILFFSYFFFLQYSFPISLLVFSLRLFPTLCTLTLLAYFPRPSNYSFYLYLCIPIFIVQYMFFHLSYSFCAHFFASIPFI